MPALLAEQRVQHAFRPYPNKTLVSRSISHQSTSSSLLPCSAREFTRSKASSSMSLDCSQVSQLASHVAQKLSDASSALNRRSVPVADVVNHKVTTRSASKNMNAGPTDATLAAFNLPKLSQTGASQPFNQTISSSRITTSPARAPAPPRPVEDIVSYLKSWRPPVEYYARRRYQHPSLSYPSRRPSLPALLEERVNPEGLFDLVRPELATPHSARVHHRKLFSKYYSIGSSSSQYVAPQGWDEESDEEIDSQNSDEEDDVWSDTESDEAVTPTSSPISTSTYFLQPLILTKPPGC